MVKPLNISNYYANPTGIDANDLVQLNQAVIDSPWCSAYRIMLARGNSNVDSYAQDKHLRIAATYSGDKKVLFEWMTSTKDSTPSLALVEETETPNIENTPAEIQPMEQTTESASEEPLPKEPKKEEKVAAEKVEQPIESEKIDFDKIVIYDPLKELEPNVIRENQKDHLLFDQVTYNPEKELAKLIEEKEEGSEHNFLFWINNLDEGKEQTEVENKKSVDHVQNLLDQFLATKRSRPIQNNNFFKAESKVAESETDDTDVISETLVVLYVKQGHYEKAIKGYRKLSLQNPDKSAYFAARIKEIQQKLS